MYDLSLALLYYDQPLLGIEELLTCWTGTACSAGCSRAASPQRGSWRSQRRGSIASPVMIGSNRKCAGNHPLSAGSPRQGATHRLDRCIVAPLLRKGFPGYPPFHAFCNYFLHATLRKCLFQNVHHILVCQHFRP